MKSAIRYSISTALLLALGVTGSIQASPASDRLSSANAAASNFLAMRASSASLTAPTTDVTWAKELGYDARALSDMVTQDIRTDLDMRLKSQHSGGN